MTWKTPRLKKLARAMLAIKTESEMLNFLRDLCTLEELEEVSSRWSVVLLLQEGKSYREIAKQTGVSTTTVTRISHWLKHGEGGYKTVVKRKGK